jgi:DNA-directed RNA polymerase I, II, and III subunit RPABC1
MADGQKVDVVAATREIGRLFRVHETVVQMLVDRGYTVDPANFFSDLAKFRAAMAPEGADPRQVRERLTLTASRVTDGSYIRVVFHKSAEEAGKTRALSVQDAKMYVTTAQGSGCNGVVIVAAGAVAATVKAWVDGVSREFRDMKVQLFPEDHLVVNITKHELVPKHVPLSDDEKKKVLEAYALDVAMLPRLLSTDPVALYFGLSKGQVVKIERHSETAGIYVTYRQVV